MSPVAGARWARMGWAPVVAAALGACLPGDPTVGAGLACEDGVCACSEGLGDCDDDPQNGCETALAADPRHCGSCGVDCLSGACLEGRCQPYELVPGLLYADSVATDGQRFYFAESGLGAIVTVDQDGTSPSLFVDDQYRDLNTAELAAGGGLLVWDVATIGSNEVVRVADSAGETVRTVAVSKWIDAVSTAGGWVAWAQVDDLGTARIKVSDEAGEVASSYIDPGGWVQQVAVGEHGELFWVTSPIGGDEIVRASPSGGASVIHSSEAFITGLAVVGEELFWLEDVENVGGKLRRISLAGGEPSDVTSTASLPRCLSQAGGALHWLEGAPLAAAPLRAIPIAGGVPKTVAELASEYCPAVGDEAVAWIQAGRVHAIAR